MNKRYGFIREWDRMVLNIYISFYKFTIGIDIRAGDYFRWGTAYKRVIALELNILILHIQLGWMYDRA